VTLRINITVFKKKAISELGPSSWSSGMVHERPQDVTAFDVMRYLSEL